jgi:protein-tyrosine phosphatase
MSTKLYWISGPWPGKPAMAARPRGEDWLEDELRDWKNAGIDVVLSLLTPEEERDLGLAEESQIAKSLGLWFASLPIPDRHIPSSPSEVTPILDNLEEELATGNNIVIHCRQGVGRSGMIAACLLVMRGMSAESAIREVEKVRGTAVPETEEQRRWIDLFASSLTKTR